ncbi:hypothetical protein [Achromobacter phage Motura]|uniref:Uncharacterized protein n=1 Tax=Achromobacter phage Motura TaxID=2591403 RepID=A0A514CSU4_9CAUD|nr:hypothetical protein H1O15_gp231 [Achromobacter phage Motura]QDH83557.1 hypothetical protein [Achromobacter phage Motura]
MKSKRDISILNKQMNDVEKVLRLPKQFNHWLKQEGLTEERFRGFRRGHNHYWKGRGRYWRINCFGVFECSERFDTFDRWANSNPQVGVSIEWMANRAQFRRAFLQMLRDVRAKGF